MRREVRRAFWRELLVKQTASGLSGRAWCLREAVDYAAFVRWRRRLRGEQPVEPLTLVRVSEAEPTRAALRVSVGGAWIEVRQDFDASLLKRVVAALSS